MSSRENRLGLLLLMPTLVLMAAFVVFPGLYACWLSLNQSDPFKQVMTFVGFANFQTLLEGQDFWHSLWVGVLFTGGTVSLQVVVGMAMALLLHRPFFGRGLARALTLFPFIVPTIVSVLIWRWLLNDSYGVVNFLLKTLGLVDAPIIWFGTPGMAMISVVLVNVWQFFPFVVITLLARLATIPDNQYEAARIDGASGAQQFLFITLPHLKTILAVVILLRGIWMFQKFEVIYLLTRGGPLRATQHLPILAYDELFVNFRMGHAAAVAVLSFLILAAASTLYLKIHRPVEAEL
jgi:multiple sugar transport system permease protein